jgi:RNase H-fold protein (predicted Holliday junction resolvase)
VLGGQEGLENIIKKHNIQEIIVSFKQNGKEKRREVNNLCRSIEADVNVTQMRLVIS